MSIKLTASDGTEFEVDRAVANMSTTVKNLLDDMDGVENTPIPLPNASSKILPKVIDYCKYHLEHDVTMTTSTEEKQTNDIIPWDQEFCKVDQETLFGLIMAANYLDIKALLDLTCKTFANMIHGKTPEEIRKLFNIENDFTPEEEEQARKENEWCEER